MLADTCGPDAAGNTQQCNAQGTAQGVCVTPIAAGMACTAKSGTQAILLTAVLTLNNRQLTSHLIQYCCQSQLVRALAIDQPVGCKYACVACRVQNQVIHWLNACHVPSSLMWYVTADVCSPTYDICTSGTCPQVPAGQDCYINGTQLFWKVDISKVHVGKFILI